MRLTMVEEQARALPLWRTFAAQKPTLLLLSTKRLRSLPAVLRQDVVRLLSQSGVDDQELLRRTAQPVADQLIAADLGVAVAMEEGWFSKVIWLVPLADGEELLPLEAFKQGLRSPPSGWRDDVDTFTATGVGTYAGVLADVPVEVASMAQLPTIRGPVLAHIDTGFFAALYRNEVKTPLYSLLSEQLSRLVANDVKLLGVSVSRDNQSFEVPLSLRSIGDDIAALLTYPERRRKPTKAMQLHAEIRYLDNFYQPDTIEKKARALLQFDPQDADHHYALYRALRQSRQLDRGLAALEKAIALDPVYANEYVELVNHALQQQQYPAALAMLDSAIRALPNNPLIRLRKAQVLTEMGRGGEAIALLRELQKLPWSEFYYPRIREDIEVLLK
ncbi:MAG: tetratricopeptide repeat protein [Desulfuromonadales bacterium]|nr:tetratricopeptide repeat protein [Desulfuromonadales bacterium]